ncbi:sugar transporter [Pseudorhodobacter sp. W20_MBD10_FR17]|uniref:sugar transporter n=1 Tax=Pseudorhodobacter sp. W20_MBD10_FR17 TaxID=3240266 RepID=UPI003F99662D
MNKITVKDGVNDRPATALPPAKQPAPQAKPTPPPPVRRAVKPARFRRRHFGLATSFIVIVLLPLSALAFYLWEISLDQYSSLTGFTVRKEEGTGASALMGGLASFTGGSVSSDGDILYEFILSQALVQKVDANIDLRGYYSSYKILDPIFALRENASIEDLEQYWSQIVKLSFDRSTGLMEMRVLAFTPDMAQAIAVEVLRLSQDMINALNEQSRADAMRYAQKDLDDAVVQLKQVRESLTAFRTKNQIVDPASDIRGRMGVMNNLQQQLAQSLIELDLLTGVTTQNNPRLSQAERLISVIRQRIANERKELSSTGSDEGSDYPALIAEYEGLTVDSEFAEESYRAARAALDLARANASRQSRYLATYIAPTMAQTSEYPRRGVIFGLAGLFLLLGWAIMALVYYSIRDRS